MFVNRRGIIWVFAATAMIVVARFAPSQAQAGESWQLVRSWGEAGTGPGQFTPNVAGITVDSVGYLYVTDRTLGVIQKFDAAGNFVTSWGTNGTAQGQFTGLYELATDSAGNIYASDTYAHRIQKFTSSGDYLQEFGGSGELFGVAVDSQGFVYAAERSADRVVKYDAAGVVVTNLTNTPTPSFLATDSSDNLYVTSLNNSTIQKFSPEGVLLGQFTTPFSYLHGLTVDQNGNIWVVDPNGNSVKKFANDGTPIVVSFDHTFSNPVDVAVAPNGFLYVSEYSATPHLHAFHELSAVTMAATRLSDTDFQLNGEVSPHNAETWAWFEWGATEAYGNTTAVTNIGVNNTFVPVGAVPTGLISGVTYHFRVVASNSFGVVYGNDLSFLAVLPVVSAVTMAATRLSDTDFQLNGQVSPRNAETWAWFDWGATEAYGNTTAVTNIGTSNTSAPVSAVPTGLISGVTYHFRVVASNSFGVVYGNDLSFLAVPVGTNADLASLVYSIGELSPAFSSDITNYTVAGGPGLNTTTVTATGVDSNATIRIRINGGGWLAVTSGIPSVPLGMHKFANHLEVSATAENGIATKFYFITVDPDIAGTIGAQLGETTCSWQWGPEYVPQTNSHVSMMVQIFGNYPCATPLHPKVTIPDYIGVEARLVAVDCATGHVGNLNCLPLDAPAFPLVAPGNTMGAVNFYFDMGLCTSLNCPQPTVAPGSSRHNMEEQNRRGLSEVHRPISIFGLSPGICGQRKTLHCMQVEQAQVNLVGVSGPWERCTPLGGSGTRARSFQSACRLNPAFSVTTVCGAFMASAISPTHFPLKEEWVCGWSAGTKSLLSATTALLGHTAAREGLL